MEARSAEGHHTTWSSTDPGTRRKDSSRLESTEHALKASELERRTLHRTHHQTLKSPHLWDREMDGHTSHFAISDCGGMTVSLTQTLGPIFGSKVATAELGIVYAATMGRYLRTGRNIPGERPRTSIAPVIVTSNNQVVMALGAAGGIRIPSAIVQVISRVIDRGMPLGTAIAAPRVHPMSSIDAKNVRHVHLRGMEIERTANGWSNADLRQWQSAKFDVDEIRGRGKFGRVYRVEAIGNRLQGIADPDGEGTSSAAVTCG